MKPNKYAFMATKFHERTFAELEALAWARAMGKVERVSIFALADNDYVYCHLGTIELPAGSRDLIEEFGKFAKTKLGPVKEIRSDLPGSETPDMDGYTTGVFPEFTYQVGMTLLGSFPRDTNTGILRSPMNGDGEIEQEDNEVQRHQAYTGVGVILMREVRNLLDPTLADDDTITKANKKELLMSFAPGENDGKAE